MIDINNRRRQLEEDLKALETAVWIRKKLIKNELSFIYLNAVWIRKKLIKNELSFIYLKRELELSQKEYMDIQVGRISEKRLEEIKNIFGKVPLKIKERRQEYKKFKLYLLEKGLNFEDAAKKLGFSARNLRSILNRDTLDSKKEKLIEKTFKIKIF